MIEDKARELGRLIGQSSEYQALRRAEQAVHDDPEAQRLLEVILRLTSEMEQAMLQGRSPDQTSSQLYETTLREFDLSPVGQGYVVARANMDKLMARVNQLIGEGMERGASSGIITL